MYMYINIIVHVHWDYYMYINMIDTCTLELLNVHVQQYYCTCTLGLLHVHQYD